GSASSRDCPRERRSWPTATRAHARPSRRWRSEPRATTPATTRAHGTSGRATRTCRQSAERDLPKKAPLTLKDELFFFFGFGFRTLIWLLVIAAMRSSRHGTGRPEGEGPLQG